MTTYTVGTSGRDYSSLAAFVADVGVGLSDGPVADTSVWTVACYNDGGVAIQESGEVTLTSLFYSGSTNYSSATYFCEIVPASGTGANGDPNDHRTRSGALDYDPSVGVAFEWSGAHDGLVDYNGAVSFAPYLKIVGIQFLHAAISYARILYWRRRTVGVIDEQCVFKCVPQANRGAAQQWTGTVCESAANNSGHTFRNNLVIVSGDASHVPAATAAGIRGPFLTSQIYSNTVVNELSGIETDIVGALGFSLSTAAVFANNLVLGFDTAWDNTGDNDGVQEYTVTDAATCDGANNVTGVTLADQIQSVTLGSLNARLKGGSDAIGAAGGTYIAADDIFDVTRDSPADVGCAEFSSVVGEGLIAGNKLQRARLVSC